jgi:hypothetical protein
VISNTACLTTLLKAGQASLLAELFDHVEVPPGVWEELSIFHRQLPNFVKRTSLPARLPPMPDIATLGRGEAEAITLALATRADLFLSDDRKALTAARAAGLRASGLVGVLLLAKRRRVIKAVCPLLEVLERQGDLYLSDEVKHEARRLAGE